MINLKQPLITGPLIIGVSTFTLALAACTPSAAEVSSFEECEEAGFPIIENFPRECEAGDQRFIEDVSDQQASSSSSSSSSSEDDVNAGLRVDAPNANAVVTSPLTISGEARGNWYFEASFPVRLLDEDGNEVLVQAVQADGEWMTEDFVPFETTLTFTAPASDRGFIVFEKSNASGLPENAAEIRIPVRFR